MARIFKVLLLYLSFLLIVIVKMTLQVAIIPHLMIVTKYPTSAAFPIWNVILNFYGVRFPTHFRPLACFKILVRHETPTQNASETQCTIKARFHVITNNWRQAHQFKLTFKLSDRVVVILKPPSLAFAFKQQQLFPRIYTILTKFHSNTATLSASAALKLEFKETTVAYKNGWLYLWPIVSRFNETLNYITRRALQKLKGTFNSSLKANWMWGKLMKLSGVSI